MRRIRKGSLYRFNYPKEFKTLPEYTAHAGQVVTLIRQLPRSQWDEHPVYIVRAADGWEGHALADELEEVNNALA